MSLEVIDFTYLEGRDDFVIKELELAAVDFQSNRVSSCL